MSHPLNLLQELLLTLFLALGCTWLVIDIARKLRAPGNAEPQLGRSETTRSGHTPPTPASSVATAAPLPAPIAPAPVAPAAAAEPLVAGIPAPHLAAITAAVHHLFKGRVRLSSLLPAPAAAAASAAPVDGAREGRRDIFTSHRVR